MVVFDVNTEKSVCSPFVIRLQNKNIKWIFGNMARLKYLGSLVTDLHLGINLVNSSI